VRRIWSPRCCPSCGEPLEEWKWPLRPDAFVPCPACALLFRVTDDGLVDVVFKFEPPEVRRVFDELVAWWFECKARQPIVA
jgi:hypothetical protein